MIKSIVILVLILALAGGAFFTRPSRASFDEMIRARMTADSGNFFEKLLLEHRIKSYLDDCTYHDRFLWVDVTRDGQTIYTGFFSHWMKRSSAKAVNARAGFIPT